jgi:hypothetical protein
LNEENLRAEFERYKNQEVIEGSPEEREELRVALINEMQQLDLPFEQWDEYLDQELSVFKKGERYDYV